VWENLSTAGAPRLILTMVAASLERELPWVRVAVPGAQITVVRLRASESTLLERVRRREVGSGEAYHARRSVEQARAMACEADEERTIVVQTTGREVVDIAGEVLARGGWIA
jgi:CO/xanthine dehydrogenase FAD-binding subunit